MKSLIELIKSMSERPGVYLSNYSIFTAESFINGWIYGQDYNVEDDVMYDFQQYIVKKYKANASLSWSRILNTYASSEERAMVLFFELFFEFIEKKEEDKESQKTKS